MVIQINVNKLNLINSHKKKTTKQSGKEESNIKSQQCHVSLFLFCWGFKKIN